MGTVAQASPGKLALGTAQFGSNYGLANPGRKVPAAEVASILEAATAAGIDTLDTAMAYGDSEACLGSIGVEGWRVVTKLPGIPEAVADVSGWIEEQVQSSLQRLRISRLEGLLLHRPLDLLGPRGEAILGALQRLKATGRVGAAGVSIYDPGELAALWHIWRHDMVQAPANVLDQRLQRSGWLARLQDSSIRVHVRSVLLQGLLVMPRSRRPGYFERWGELLHGWDEWCAAQGAGPLSAALSAVYRWPGVERIVIGFDSLGQLQEVLSAVIAGGPSPPPALFCEDRELLEPSRWKLR